MVVCACDPSYGGNINRRTAGQASLGKKCSILFKTMTKSKNGLEVCSSGKNACLASANPSLNPSSKQQNMKRNNE
jgi:hypothetical protein